MFFTQGHLQLASTSRLETAFAAAQCIITCLAVRMTLPPLHTNGVLLMLCS